MQNYQTTFMKLSPKVLMSRVSRALNVALALILLFSGAVYAAPTAQQQFIGKMLPAINLANGKVTVERDRLTKDYSKWTVGQVISKGEWSWIAGVASKYKLKNTTLYKKDDWQNLLNRVDIVPAPLVLSQAINESAWGKSRFAKQGNNYFGRWCYVKGCGIVPLNRAPNKKYELKSFPSMQASVEDYLLNINTNDAYKTLRAMRKSQHKNPGQLDAKKLAQGLLKYSERGQAYVNDIKSIISKYHL